MAQPLAVEAAELSSEQIVDQIEELERATPLQLRTLQFDIEAGNQPLVGFRPFDARILNETVRITHEGVLPGTSRSDGVLETEAADDGSIWMDVGFDPCNRGVRTGDHVIFTAEPSDSCQLGGDPEYEVVERNATAIRLAPIGEPLAARVPTRGCFGDVAAAYEVRPVDEWIVVGDTLGYFSEYQSAFGECVPRYAADQVTSRVKTGEVYQGPYYSLYMYPGFAPERIPEFRDTVFTFQISSGFQAVLFPTCSSLGSRCSAGFFPSQVLWVPGLENGSLLVSPDPNDDFIHIRNLDDAGGAYTVVR
jgi:hypothetical protein